MRQKKDKGLARSLIGHVTDCTPPRPPPPHVLVSRVRSKSKASKAGLCEGDEVVSINGKPCADLTYSEVITLMEGLTDALQLLIKRSSNGLNESLSPETENKKHDKIKNEDYRESTTLQIRTATQMPQKEFYITEIHSDTSHGAEESDFSVTKQEKETMQCHKITPKVIETSRVLLTDEAAFKENTKERRPGTVVELQLSLSHDRHKDTSASEISLLGAEKCTPSETRPSVQEDGTSPVTAVPLCEKEATVQWSSKTFQIASGKEVKVIQGSEAGDPSLPRVEVILDCSNREKEVSRSLAEKGCVASQVEGGQSEAPPSVVSFGISSEGTEQGEDDQHSERDHSRPHKHRARHARLRRSQSLSEKQVKEAKSKCKSIALLLTAAPNPNSKGVLMFKKRRQRARKYTLVSYGTGELERDEEEGEEEEGEGDKENTFEITLLGTSESEIDEDFFSDIDKEGQIVTFDWDTGLLEVEKKLKGGDEMQMLPESKGKGALMFAKRRQRMDEITAEQEEMKLHGMHAEVQRGTALKESFKQVSSSSYPVKEEATSKKQSCVSKSYIEVSHSHGNMVQQNGIGGASESYDAQKLTSLNRTAKPFPGIQNRAAAPFSPTRNVTSPLSDLPAPPSYSTVSPLPQALYAAVASPVASRPQTAIWSPTESTEQIASRDERIAVPAIRTGILQEAKKRSTAKPMFTFKEPPKVSPNPALLSLVQNKEGKRSTGAGFESGPEEDYLSLGAEACNFMQIQASKQKTPPPVAPKPSVKVSPTAVTPISPVWSPPAVASTQPPAFPTPNSPQTAVSAPIKLTQPAHPPPRPPSTLKIAGPFKGPQAAVSKQNYTPKTPTTPIGNIALAGGMGPAFEMPPAFSGKGAQLFAKRQSRMEKYVVDSETVQAHMARASSPTPSLPACWKYSSNVRAPPPVAYNPIQSPSYPLAATKSQSKSPAVTKNTKRKPKKALSALDVMKHQPYQLNASLFTFQPPSATKEGLPTKQSTKFDSVSASKHVLHSRPLSAGPSANVQASSVYSVPAYSSQPLFQSNAPTPVNESYEPSGYPSFSKQESITSSMFTAPRPKFSAKKVGVTAQERDSGCSSSLPGQSSSLISQAMSPASPVMFQPGPGYFSQSAAAADKPGKRLTPWEAAAKSPLGLVDDAFGPQNIQESIAANVVSAARRKTLPEPPDDWKQRVSCMPPAPGIHTNLASFGRRQSGIMSPPKSTMSAPNSTFQCGSRLQYAYYGQRSRTDPDMMSMDSRSDYCLSMANSNYNPHPRGWRRQT
ncbi:synaptopodin-2 isoform X2 [Pelodiscus sinensis]|uniref:synaptopodin-2 isoform X2 n=1 Tax=Pelodiscus sinensis TaxID=13735 RepID=UPI000D722D6D|nr:synaptopodin-2 isoform X2 [Pelodiscus sinensis]|eukprot:XP_025046470.1 synaptopodin-2 isoform X2 [Pelodiscus sinensis]